jgi:hypothetical protein
MTLGHADPPFSFLGSARHHGATAYDNAGMAGMDAAVALRLE